MLIFDCFKNNLQDCFTKTPAGTIERFSYLLDCYMEMAKNIQLINHEFPKNTPETVQTAVITPNGKNTFEVFLSLLELIPPEQFLCVEDINDVTKLIFNKGFIYFASP